MNFGNMCLDLKNKVDFEIISFFKELNLLDKSNDFEKLMNETLSSFMLNGGKRLRPLSLIMAYKSLKKHSDGDELIIPVSLCVELFHASTLIHDDIMDEDLLRRGQDTVFEKFRKSFLKKYSDKNLSGPIFKNESSKYGVNQAIIAGNMLNTLCHYPINKSSFSIDKINLCNSILSDAYFDVNLGQYKDIDLSFRDSVNQSDYLDMVHLKTGRLLIISIQIGLILADCSSDVFEKFTSYANKIALVFQIKDDLMDIDKNSLKGRKIGSDFVENKQTLLFIKTLEMVSDLDREKILDNVGNDDFIEEYVGLCKSSGSGKFVFDYALMLVNDAKLLIDELDLSAEGSFYFKHLAEFVLGRRV